MSKEISLISALANGSTPSVARVAREYPAFCVEASGIRMANELSKQSHLEWFDIATPPFRKFIMEWSPSWYIQSNTPNQQLRREAAIYNEGWITFWALDTDNTCVLLPFELIDDTYMGPPRTGAPLEEQALDLLWGPKLISEHGTRPAFRGYYGQQLTDMIDSSNDPAALGIRISRMLTELAGIVRITYAQMALINTHRPTLILPSRDGRRYFPGKGFKANYRPNTILIRPDAVREIVTREADPFHTPGAKKRDHPVREHFRHYKSGKRVIVREHRRGDKNVGTVGQRNYIIEADPNKGLN